MSGVSLTALAAQIKKSNKDLVTANSLTKEEKLALKKESDVLKLQKGIRRN